jgi:hypothetical protein
MRRSPYRDAVERKLERRILICRDGARHPQFHPLSENRGGDEVVRYLFRFARAAAEKDRRDP